ncbi:hypothetical protein CANARDRAFT_190422, partial [[Candida] arabinofermentans NRRL YB-2248]
MDASTVLEQYTQDLSNLPAELAYLLEELRDKDLKSYDIKKKFQQRDSQLHKYIKQNGSLVKHPKEDQIYSKIREDFEKATKLQEEKCILANTSLFLISKHLTRLEKDIERLERDGVIPPIMNDDSDEDMDGESLPAAIESLSSQISNSSLDSAMIANKKSKQPKVRSRQGTPSITLITGMFMKSHRRKNNSGGSNLLEHGASGTVTIPKIPIGAAGNEEDELYCFCQQVSYGNMIACDNSDCKYEWFHYDCVGLKEPPQGIWYCPYCVKEMGELGTMKK